MRRPRLPAGAKLLALAVAGTGAFWITDVRLLALGLLAAIGLAAACRAGLRWRGTAAACAGAVPVLALVLLGAGLGGDWRGGLEAVLRLSALMLLAGLVTATTPASAMAAAIASALRPLRWIGIDPGRPALALSLAMRLLPLIAAEAAAVREAQRARGLERHPLALFVPLVIRVMKMADGIADAIEARSGD